MRRPLTQPTDLDGAQTMSGVRLAGLLSVAALTASLLGAQALADWANGLPVSPVSDALLRVTDLWLQAMQHGHVTAFAETVRDLWRAFQGAG